MKEPIDYLSTLFVGIDIASRIHVVSALDFNENFYIKMKPVENTQEGAALIEQMMSSIISELEKKEKLGAQSGEILKKLWKNINWMTVAKTAGKTALGIATGTAPLCVVMIFCVFISLAVFLFACQLMGIFTTPEETEILNIGIGYLRVEGAGYCGIGILFLLYGYFRAVERPKVSLVLTVISLGTRVLLTHVCAPFLVWEQSGGRYLWDGCWQILQVFFG